ncbi:SusC/RagA family TonB-linked outer membrane protein [Pedobacter metabolipauper]|uniref:TonB-linked SusC/RagA family outer membrane protein n=1 Tax=Pedobacter metabolipauper TaxID=425513 RepID=A0A4R6SYZ9_9SPHI|nr:TonB-dependent receptor [Pedobacter metabolipauper]TDQ11287.1 TonB-linked SusC/RagA family outer membrane protein [Pedobacter metabolipauper]
MKKHLLPLQKVMRYTLLVYSIMIASSQILFAGITNGQVLNKRIDISFENENLLRAINKLRTKSGVDFAYDPAVLKLNRFKTSSQDFDNEKIEVILNAILNQTNVTYREEVAGIITLVKNQDPGKITGKIVDEKGIPLPGASIKVLELNKGTQSAADGSYSISAAPGIYTLTISYISFTSSTQTKVVVKPGESTTLNVSLTAQTGTLNEVLVVGYGTQKRENLTGAVDQISSKALENRSVSNLAQGLQGMIPNLNLTMGDGKPTQSPSFNIRGTTSIGQGGNALVLVDGVEGDPSRINPNDIASVTVLKDAASASIYGARGAFGVVLITTKNPVKERTSINYSIAQSIKKPTTVPDYVTDGYTFANMFNEGWSAWNDYSQTPQNVNKSVKFSPAYLAELKRRSEDPSLPKVEVNSAGEYVYYDNTDWYKELYKSNNNATEQNLSLSGGSGKTDFYVSGRSFRQSGLFRYNSDDYQTYNVRAKGSIELYPWLKVYNNADYSASKYHNPLNVGEGGGIWRNIADEGHNMAPMYNPDGTLSFSAAYTVGDFAYGKNGIDMFKKVFRNTTGFTSNFFDDKFRVKGDVTFQNTNNDETRIRVPVPYSRKPGVIEYVGSNYNDIQQLDRTTQYLATNIYAEYEPRFSEDHYLKVLAGYNYEQSTYKRFEAVRNGLIFEDAKDLNLALGQSITTGGGYEQWAILGGFYRLNYAYKDRYLVELNGRYDGSSKFPTDQRYAFFPSVSAGWRISKESFWNVDPKTITDVKIRASYGSLGNGNIASYAFLEKFGISQSDRVLNGVRPQQSSQPGVIPEGLTWETSTTQNIALDIAFLNNRLNFSGDAYIRKTTDMFTVGMTLPSVYGIGVPKGNYADLKTKGWEATLSWNDRFDVGAKPFNYNIRLTLADYTAKILKFNNPDQRLSDYYAGQTVGEIWGFETDGYYTSAEDIANSPVQTLYKSSNTGKSLPGDIKFKDLNGDGVINNGLNTVGSPGDRKVIGNSTPRYTYGISLGADWKGFFFSTFFQGVGKMDWYPGTENGTFWGQYNRPYNKVPESQLGNIWSPENPNAYFPRYRGYIAQNGSGTLAQAQTKYLQNVAYIRLKNLQVGYNLPQTFIKNAGLSNVRLFLTGENLWSWSPLYKITKDLDIESIGGSDRVLTDGTNGNGNNYPILKSFSMGISATF